MPARHLQAPRVAALLSTFLTMGPGCGKSAPTTPWVGPPVGTTHASPPEPVTPVEAALAPASIAEPVIPPAVVALVAAVAAFEAAPADPGHELLVAALRALSEAMLFVPGANSTAAAHVGEAAGDLESSPRTSTSHADSTKEALSWASDGLAPGSRQAPDALRPSEISEPGPDRTSGAAAARSSAAYQAALRALEAAVARIDVDRPLLDQHEAVVSALQAATDVILIGGGASPLYARYLEATGAAATAAVDPEAVRERLDAAREVVRGLATSDWVDLQPVAARALEAFADALAAATDDRDEDLRARIAQIRLSALRLRRAAALGREPVRWTREGLATTLEAVELAEPSGRAALEPWLLDARQVLDGLRPTDTLSFQRPVVQDAFRAVLAALAVALEPQVPEGATPGEPPPGGWR